MITTILALLIAAPTASANDEYRRRACEKVGGNWTDTGVCEYTSVSTELKYVQIRGIEELGIFQVALRDSVDEEWTMPTEGEVFVELPSGAFALAPLEVGVQMFLDPDHAEAYVEELALEPTELPVEQLLEAGAY